MVHQSVSFVEDQAIWQFSWLVVFSIDLAAIACGSAPVFMCISGMKATGSTIGCCKTILPFNTELISQALANLLVRIITCTLLDSSDPGELIIADIVPLMSLKYVGRTENDGMRHFVIMGFFGIRSPWCSFRLLCECVRLKMKAYWHNSPLVIRYLFSG